MNARPGHWLPVIIADLTRLWSEGHSSSEIGRRLSAKYLFKFTKSAVIGKVHRLKLPPRPSPVDINKSNDTKRRTRARRVAYLAEYPI